MDAFLIEKFKKFGESRKFRRKIEIWEFYDKILNFTEFLNKNFGKLEENFENWRENSNF